MTISRKAVRAILEFIDQRPDVVDYFRGVIAPEEAFLPTVLANNPNLKLTREELRYAEFHHMRHGALKEFRIGDLEGVLASGCYLARKFDFKRDPDVLEALDKIVFPLAGQHSLRVVPSAPELELEASMTEAALPRAS
jgi:hypothetical protein